MKKQGLLFKIIKGIVKLFYKTPEFSGVENLPSEPTIIIGNHAQMHGPIVTETYMPNNTFVWVTGEMLSVKEFPSYAYEDFWRLKPKSVAWFYKGLSYVIAPLCAYIFKNAKGIGVYKDIRIANTLKNTVIRLKEGNNVVIFPEGRTEYNEIVNDFQKNFVDVARVYYKVTKKEITFTPCYIAPKLKKVVYGKPIKFDSTADYTTEKERIIEELKKEITSLAKSLPVHTVVPYANINKKNYPKSK